MKEIEREIIKIFEDNNLNEEEKKLFLMLRFNESIENKDYETAKICQELLNRLST